MENAESNPAADGLLKCLCRHFVSLQGTYDFREGGSVVKETFFAFSGFVIEVGDTWFYVTAGHVLKQMEKRLADPRVTIKYLSLFDGFHDSPHEGGVPFCVDGAGRWVIDDDEAGLDAGVILLSPCYRAALERNGIVPITPGCWEGIDEMQFDGFAVLGLPDELLEKKPRTGVRGERIIGGGRAVLTFLVASDSQPVAKPKPQNAWFAGTMKASESELGDMDGMSGGPIFCFKKGPPFSYGVVAVQSCWDRRRRLAFGTSFPAFLDALAAYLAGNLLLAQTGDAEWLIH
jgi:hypothetical protein